jgi:hypothetical protein
MAFMAMKVRAKLGCVLYPGAHVSGKSDTTFALNHRMISSRLATRTGDARIGQTVDTGANARRAETRSED